MPLTVGKYLLDQLKSFGVEHIFGVPGDYILRFDKMIEEHDIAFINTTRENTAGYMADAYARVRGLGVACVTYGVSINIANAVSQAFAESSPVVFISGAAGISEEAFAHYVHHYLPKRENIQLKVFEKMTVRQAVLNDPATAKEEIDKALQACLKEKKPVYIELPRDIVDAPIATHVQEKSCGGGKENIPQEALKEIEQLLTSCRQPVIWAGHEISRFQLAAPLLQFAERFCIPIVSSLLGKSVISEFSPLYLGLYQGALSSENVREYVGSCDLLLVLGVALSDVDTGLFTASFEGKHVVVASSRSLAVDKRRFPEAALPDVVRGLAAFDADCRFAAPRRDVKGPCKAPEEVKITSKRTFEILQGHVKEEHIVISDFGDCLFGGAELTVSQDSFFSNAFFSSLGFAVPGAIGLQFARPKRRVIALVGDGAFQMSATELSTAARYGVDPVIILLDNKGFATERPLLDGDFNDVHNWNYEALPLFLNGGKSYLVRTEKELDSALASSLASRGAYQLIVIELEKYDYSPGLERFCRLVHEKKMQPKAASL